MSAPVASRIADVEDAIYAAVEAAARPGSALAGARVDLGEPLELQKVHVWVSLGSRSALEGEATGFDEVGSWTEAIDVEVQIHVQQLGADWRGLRTRVEALAGEVVAAVRAEPTLGGVVVDAGVAGFQRHPGAIERGIALLTTVHVRATAQVP